MEVRQKILIVEDDGITAKAIQHYLERTSYTVTAVVATGEEAIRKAEEDRPDLVLMDIVLHGEIDGIEAAGRIYQTFNIPVVFLTAYTDSETLKRAKVTEPFGYVVKPFQERELVATVEMALYQHQHVLRGLIQAVRASEEKFRSIVENSIDAIILMDQERRVISCNRGFFNLFGYEGDEVEGRSIRLIHLADESYHRFGEMAIPSIRKEGFFRTEWDFIRKDGELVPVETVMSSIKSPEGTIIGFVSIIRDITERRQAEAERNRLLEQLRVGRERLRSLSRRIVEMEEANRRSLSREIHDQLGASLAALSIQLSILEQQLPKEMAAQVETGLNESQRIIDESVDYIRNLMAELRPPMLDDFGLIAALRWYGERFFKQTHIRTLVRGRDQVPRLPAASEIVLFRIAQEALNNAAKHSRAGEVSITLEEKERAIRLTIEDNGSGFDPSVHHQKGARPEYGMMIMRERAEALAGELRIESAPGKGTKVIVEVPRK